MNVPLTEVQKRDPKGLYKKVAAGEIKGFTGIDAPYEAPEKPDIDLPNWDMSIEECVQTLIAALKREGVLSGGAYDESGLPVPPGFDGEVRMHSFDGARPCLTSSRGARFAVARGQAARQAEHARQGARRGGDPAQDPHDGHRPQLAPGALA